MSDDEQAPVEPRATAGAAGGGRFRLGRLGPFEIEGHVLLLPILAVVGFVLATSLLPATEKGAYDVGEYALLGFLGTLVLLLSVFAHELSHALAGRLQGLPVERITLFFHGERPEDRHEGASPASELLIAGVGPAVSLLLGAGSWVGAWMLPEARFLGPLLRFSGVANLLLGLASLIPAFPLDGGRLVRALAWQLTGSRLQGTRLACGAGRLLAGLLLAFAFWQMLRGGLGSSAFWGLALALLVYLQAGATWRLARVREGLEGLTAGELAEALPPVLPRQVSVQDALFSPELAPARGTGRAHLVEFQGRLGGVAPLRHLRRVPEEARAGTPIWEVTTRLRGEHLLAPELPAAVAHERLIRARLPLLPVLAGGELRGVVTRQGLEQAIERRLSGAERGNPGAPPA